MASKKQVTVRLVPAKKAAAKSKRAVEEIPDLEPQAGQPDDAEEPKTTAERVRKLRDERSRLGLKRLELYVHPEDWGQVKTLAAKLQRKRAKSDTGA